jgi:hypothetical protein
MECLKDLVTDWYLGRRSSSFEETALRDIKPARKKAELVYLGQ